MNPEPENDDRAARGLRIFEALRRGKADEAPIADAGTTTAVQDPPPAASPPDPPETSTDDEAAPSPPAPTSGDPGASTPDASPDAPPEVVPEVAPEPERAPEDDAASPPPTSAAPSEPPSEGAPDAAAPTADTAEPADVADAAGVADAGDEAPTPALPGADALGSTLQAPAPVAPPAPTKPAKTAPAMPPAERRPTIDPSVAVAGSDDVPGEMLPLPRVIAIANQKGGVGKTTTAVNLSAALTELDYRVLVIDLDPQGNATTGVGVDIRNLDLTVYEALMSDTPLEDCVEPTSVRNLFVAPSNMDLAGAEIELVPMFSRELKLRRAIEGVKDDYDFVLIDCPPSLGLLTVNGLAAADDVVVPIQCEYYALEGLGQLVNNVNLVRANLNPVLDIRGIVLTMYDARTKLADQVVEEVRRHFGPKVFKTVVPRTVRLSEAPSFGQPIIVFDSHSRGSDAYRGLARELAERVDGGAERIARYDAEKDG